MRSVLRGTWWCLLCWLAMLPAMAAENEGQEDLDRAMEINAKARTMKDLSEIVNLCESAHKKGLDKSNAEFANNLLASTLLRRGLVVARTLFEAEKVDPNWAQFRAFALSDLERAVKLDPKQAEALFNIGRLELLPGGNREHAKDAIDQAIKVGADQPQVRAKALLLRAGLTREPAKQRADLNEAVRIAPGDPSAVLARGLFLADAGEFDAALADLDKAIEARPRHAGAYEAKAMILTKQKKYDQALLALDKAKELNPDSTLPYTEQARIYALQKNYAAAFHALEQAIEKHPDDLTALLMRAAIHQEAGDRDKALEAVDEVLRKKPNLAPAMRMRAMILAGEGKFDLAIQEMEKLRKENPKDSHSLLQLGMLYSAEHRYDEAIKIYDQVLSAAPDDVLALRSRGDALLGLGKHAEAIADYEKAYKLEPKDSGLLNNFAWVLATSTFDNLRNGKRAIQLATEAAKLTEYKQAHILSTLGAAYAEMGDFKAAMEWSQKAIAAGSAEQKTDLEKELASYKAGKPWRELQAPKREKPKPEAKKKAEGEKKPQPKVKPKVEKTTIL
jgi:tetratricopeptide (TPR) repeat protein